MTVTQDYILGTGPGGGTSIDSYEVHHGSFFLAVPKGTRTLTAAVQDATGSAIGAEYVFYSCENCVGISIAEDYRVGNGVSCSGDRVRVPAAARWVQIGLGTPGQENCSGVATAGTLTLVFGLR